MPDPAAPAYLNSTYASKPDQMGGTLIAEDVVSFEEHRRRGRDPDGYRPKQCTHCGRRPHAHDRRARKLRDQPDSAEEDIRRYRCRPCGAVWQVLPAFLCRYLHRTWSAVQSMLVASSDIRPGGTERRVRLKPATVARWRARLNSSARVLMQALYGTGATVARVLDVVGLDGSRVELLEALASAELVAPEHKLAQLAYWSHRLVPGLRLM